MRAKNKGVKIEFINYIRRKPKLNFISFVRIKFNNPHITNITF